MFDTKYYTHCKFSCGLALHFICSIRLILNYYYDGATNLVNP
jgi:hypothetical protein